MTKSLDDLIAEDSEKLEAAATPEQALNRIHQLILQDVEHEVAATALQAQLDEINNKRRQILEKDLPQIMQQARLKKASLEDGTTVTIKEDIYASIAAGNVEAAYSWLTTNGHADIIKNELKSTFGRGEEELAKAAEAALTALGVIAERKRSVHPSTLKAFLREQLAKGVAVPLETFSVGFITKATYKLPKKGD